MVPAAVEACSEVAGTSTGSLAAGSSAVAPPPAAELVAGANATGQPAAGGSSSAQPAAPQQQRPPGEYRCRTVVLTFRDPSLPHQLKRFVGSEVRLLKLYESGLPGWAVLLPSLGLWYRPWLRRLTWLLFVVLSVVSMAMGFYDLYKNVPYFKTAMVAAFRPAAAVFEWLEGHTQIRLSILLTYLHAGQVPAADAAAAAAHTQLAQTHSGAARRPAGTPGRRCIRCRCHCQLAGAAVPGGRPAAARTAAGAAGSSGLAAGAAGVAAAGAAAV